MIDKRASGVLMPISSLLSEFGIGDLGPGAYSFIDFLHQSKQTYWQVLPLNPTETAYGNSPYSSFSAFAANPLFLSPYKLKEDGFLTDQDIKGQNDFPKDKVDYPKAIALKKEIIDKAFARFKQNNTNRQTFEEFCGKQFFWLDDFSLFVTLKMKFNGILWNEWPSEFRDRQKEALSKARQELAEAIEKEKFIQFCFDRQWQALKNYAAEKRVLFIGDIPIYVNEDSADVWAHQDLFQLDDQKKPRFVAGVPPDYFSETGQRWGNPIYHWDRLKETGFSWWLDRLRINLRYYDITRIDHFRGLVAYWQIPSHEETAINGTWIPAPVDDFFHTIKEQLPELKIIAEDLGMITDDVREAIARHELPGMKVLQFAFNGDQQAHPYLPHNYIENCVVYTGTHDNNTIKGWFENDAADEEKHNIEKYLKHKITKSKLPWDLITLAMQSKANTAIIPTQDLLGLGSCARMNTPGTTDANWQWRMKKSAISSSLIEELKVLTEKTQRV